MIFRPSRHWYRPSLELSMSPRLQELTMDHEMLGVQSRHPNFKTLVQLCLAQSLGKLEGLDVLNSLNIHPPVPWAAKGRGRLMEKLSIRRPAM